MLCATQNKGVIPQSLYDGSVVAVTKGFENLKLVKKGDFVISLRSFQGGIEYAYYRGIIIPPKDEIKGFTKLNEVNELIYAFEDNVNALKEYKKHLISDIITGKIKV